MFEFCISGAGVGISLAVIDVQDVEMHVPRDKAKHMILYKQ